MAVYKSANMDKKVNGNDVAALSDIYKYIIYI